MHKLTGYVVALNRFISRASVKCHLFYDVLCKNKGFDWTQEHEDALQALNQYLASLPLLSKPSVGETVQLYLAVRNTFVSVVLTREIENQQLPIYYASKSLLDTETMYSSLKKIVLALADVVKQL